MKKSNSRPKTVRYVILWGGTGQAKVLRPIIEYYGSKIIAIFDYTPNLTPPFKDIPLYHDSKFPEWLKKQKNKKEIGFCVAIGRPSQTRLKIYTMLKDAGLTPVSVIHPNTIIAKNAEIGEGVQMMAGAIIQPEAIIGKACIINTRASIDHECILGDGVVIAPGAVLCGSVKVKNNAWVAAGATVLPWLTIGENVVVGAGAVVTKNVPNNMTVVGVPAKPIKRKTK